jgi:hypothetical protein
MIRNERKARMEQQKNRNKNKPALIIPKKTEPALPKAKKNAPALIIPKKATPALPKARKNAPALIIPKEALAQVKERAKKKIVSSNMTSSKIRSVPLDTLRSKKTAKKTSSKKK